MSLRSRARDGWMWRPPLIADGGQRAMSSLHASEASRSSRGLAHGGLREA